ncbi:predicted protein [Nematostella vectensis]|uniref:STAS domain-containing protein n=1 Tax=Nematostella vectensis TaxID=45351 RepID=A7RG03_NEMVE|nr:predicted protein [Nematostella vectensis]|eukprot:XP_001641754.1 predicted protein [Nematostella vectensis]
MNLSLVPRKTVDPQYQIDIQRSALTEGQFGDFYGKHEKKTFDNRSLRKRVLTSVTGKVTGMTCSPLETLEKLFPIVQWLPKYNFRKEFVADLTGGMTVGVMHIPQGLAFAMLASLPPVTGLYTALIPVMIYMLMGTSKYLSQGSFAVICLMVAQVSEREVQSYTPTPLTTPITAPYNASSSQPPMVGPWSELDSRKMEIAVTLALLIGIMQILMGLCRLGFVATYLSDPLISGFTTGSAVLVVLSQLKHIFGQVVPQNTGAFASIKVAAHMLKFIASSNPGAIITGVLCLVILVTLKFINEKYKKRLPIPIPAELLVVALGTAISYGASLSDEFGVKVLGEIPKGLPPISIPSFKRMRTIVPDAFVISVVIFATNISLARMFAKKNGQTVDANQELLAYGMCNVGGSFFSCFPICNALARTVVQENLASTQLCSIPVICLILLVLLFMAPLFYYLPKAILAAVVIANLGGLLKQFARLRQLWCICRTDAVTWFVTCFGVILLGVDLGLGLGVITTIFVVIIRQSRPRVSILGHIKDTELYRDTQECPQAAGIPNVKILRFESSLFFANAGFIKERIMSFMNPLTPTKRECIPGITTDEAEVTMELNAEKESLDTTKRTNREQGVNANIKAVIVDASAFTFIDSVGITAIKTIITEGDSRGVHVCLAACSYHLRKQLEAGGLEPSLNNDHLFVSIHDAVLFTLQAHTRYQVDLTDHVTPADSVHEEV